MIIPPYYYTPTEDEIFAYYKAICEGCDLPIMLYNNPFTSNVDMSAKLVGRLTKSFEQIRYIKEAPADRAHPRDHRRIDGPDERLGGPAGAGVLQDGRQGLREPLWQLHPPRLGQVRGVGRTGPVGRRLGRPARDPEVRRDHHEGHPLYGHQCYSKALAAAAGYPVGDVRAPITTFESLGAEGRDRVARWCR
jgi:4-hydroxy-tetrahydrodipicolinate synthase